MNKRNYYGEFEAKSIELAEQLKAEYLERISNSRDAVAAYNAFNRDVLKPLQHETAEKIRKQEINANFLYDLENSYKLDKSKERSEIFNEMIDAIGPSKIDESMRLLTASQGQTLTASFIEEEFSKQNDLPSNPVPVSNNTVIWKGENETELVQLIYALHEAGLLNNREKERTKLVSQVATFFNFDLGPNWQSNFSKSVNDRKPGYRPKIFGILEQSFLAYQSKMIEKNNKK